MEIKNLNEVAGGILEAIKKKRKIVIYGDADLDGVSSVIIAKEAIEEAGGRVSSVYFPNREKEGYGITQKGLKKLKKYAPGLFLVFDCGIGNFKEVKEADVMGFEVFIIDHHKILEKVPEASLVVDPHREDDPYPFKDLAAAALSYKIAKAMLSKAKRWKNPEKYLELAAMATLADQMPLIDENEKMVQEGIKAINYTKREGLISLIDLSDFKNTDIVELQQKVIAVLNAGETEGDSNQIYDLLTASKKDAPRLASFLIEKLKEKKEKVKDIIEEVEFRMKRSSGSIVFQGNDEWKTVLLGPAASKICRKYDMPVFLYKEGETDCQGAVRNPSNEDGVRAMETCKDFLESYGGHAQASGFRVKKENLDNFKTCLEKYFEK
jgi:single-stranded-DNA-specific exonuclease